MPRKKKGDNLGDNLDLQVLKEISGHIPLEKIELVGMTYSMGDAFSKITDIRKVKGRGVNSEKAGEKAGVGTRVFDEIRRSGLKAVLIPGLHRGVKSLDRRFRALYSHCASGENLSLSYHSYLEVNKKKDAKNMIISDISSNTVTIGIRDGAIFGAIDACLGAIGISHGPLDLEFIRRVDKGEFSATRAYYLAGAKKIFNTADPNKILEPENDAAQLALDALILSVKMEIFGFLAVVKPDAFVITGSAGVHKNVFEPLKDSIEEIAPVFKIDRFAPARGGAEIARDILNGKKDFLGVKVDY